MVKSIMPNTVKVDPKSVKVEFNNTLTDFNEWLLRKGLETFRNKDINTAMNCNSAQILLGEYISQCNIKECSK